MMLSVVARWARSVKAVLDDWASAFCTVVAPPAPPIVSYPSLCTGYAPGIALAALVAESTSRGRCPAGPTAGGLAFRMLVLTFMPSFTAVASTYGLNDEPTCSRA